MSPTTTPRKGEPGRVVGPGFHADVALVVRRVPAGRVATYGDIAGALGSRRVARHVGFALAAMNTDDVPWHRIVNGRGRISLDGGALAEQALRLIAEGVHVDETGRIATFSSVRLSLAEQTVLQSGV